MPSPRTDTKVQRVGNKADALTKLTHLGEAKDNLILAVKASNIMAHRRRSGSFLFITP